jgi:selenocysteine lyase/cysteine desulfurase
LSDFPFAPFRKRFPILSEKIQLSSCSQSALSIQVKDAIQDYMNSWQEHGMDWVGWMNAVEEARKCFATLINADMEDVAVVSSVSQAASAIATCLNYTKERNEVVLTDMDFPCIGHVWLSQQSSGAHISFISSYDDQIPLERYEKGITEKTLLTSIPHVAYYNGFEQDLKEIAAIAHKKGALLFVDAYQSAGNVGIDVKDSNIDFLAAGLQKYLLGVPGLAFLYIKREIADQLTPRVTGWFGQSNPFLFDIKNVDYAQGARKFDSGTPAMINGFAAKEGLKLLLEAGMDRIDPYLRELSTFTINYAKEKGLIIKSPDDAQVKGSNTAIYVENANEIEQKMKKEGVIVSARKDVIRIAPHFYNTRDDIKEAVDLLATLVD